MPVLDKPPFEQIVLLIEPTMRDTDAHRLYVVVTFIGTNDGLSELKHKRDRT